MVKKWYDNNKSICDLECYVILRDVCIFCGSIEKIVF